MGRLELLAQDLRRAERELKKAYIWLGVWVSLFLLNIIVCLVWLWNYDPFVGPLRVFLWLLIVPIFMDPFVYFFFFGMFLYYMMGEQKKWSIINLNCRWQKSI
ncbi:hypothetical protein [Streptococcus cuniculipharyngis]|uniref:Uncharacterized protein n=1 Tax=Streptococcus cuniculipharyngis TaxID=1562651 RepID=A0A5C5SCJ8_9STRE|nr:hypothetical protein [Streptococcus cuniculipharyngis]TWS98807.1 hypothetical protein FRX57_00925 [Streptococcus cuniculipharyngis]